MKETDSKQLMKNALLELRRLRALLESQKQARTEPIAIVGMSCRFPGADSTDAYWDLLKNGKDAISKVPKDRWDVEQFFDSDPQAPGKVYSRYGGYIGPLDGFDASFFNIAFREAACMDPQQRVLLEVTWEALENANINPQDIYGADCGVFLGIGNWENAVIRFGIAAPDTIGPYEGTGSCGCVAAGRIAYVLGLTGPNLAVDTACSSSLLSAHLACESLRRRECNMALAGGSHLLLLPGMSICFCKAGMLSPDGRSKAFDADANGYVRSEGCGMVVLKRLSDAKKDGDRIYALIRGSAVNQDGASGGLTVPSGPSQEAVIRKALEKAELTTDQIGYIEAHGTGTPLGDPIELRAIGNVFCKKPRPQPLVVGSVKTNIGHLESSAGVSALMKTALMLHHKQIPPHLHFKHPSPHIDWKSLDVQIPITLQPWDLGPYNERIAGISSFGFSGTNVHAILSEYRPPENQSREQDRNGPFLLILSAKHPQSLTQLAKQYITYLESNSQDGLADICYTAMTCRAHFAKRLAIVAYDKAQVISALTGFVQLKSHDALWSNLDLSDNISPDMAKHPEHLVQKAKAYVSGSPLSWPDIFGSSTCRKVTLPTYAFYHASFPVNPFGMPGANPGEPIDKIHPLLSRRVASALKSSVYETILSADNPVYLKDHQVFDRCVLPGACFVEMALKAGSMEFSVDHSMKIPVVEDISFQTFLDLDTPKCVQVILSPVDGTSSASGLNFEIFSTDARKRESWTLHANGRLGQPLLHQNTLLFAYQDEIKTGHYTQTPDVSAFYENLQQIGFGFGPHFHSILKIHCGRQKVLGEIDLNENLVKDPLFDAHMVHPILLDGCFQLFNCLTAKPSQQQVFIPVGIEKMVMHKRPGHKVWVKGHTISSTNTHFKADLTLISENREVIGQIIGLTGRAVTIQQLKGAFLDSNRDYLYHLDWIEARSTQNQSDHETGQSATTVVFLNPKLEAASSLVKMLRDNGHHIVEVVESKGFVQHNSSRFGIDPEKNADFETLFNTLVKTSDQPVTQIIHLWTLGRQSKDIKKNFAVGWQSLLGLFKSKPILDQTITPRLWVVTASCVNVNQDIMPNVPWHATMWGFSRVAMFEFPELDIRCIDVSQKDLNAKSAATDIAQNLCNEICQPDSENQIAWRGPKRYVSRLHEYQPFNDPSLALVRLGIQSYEGLESLELIPLDRKTPKPDEVEIKVHSAGLNFRDVLHALGMLKPVTKDGSVMDPGNVPLGFECSGIITATGNGVTGFKPGDRVIAALAKSSLASYVNVKSDYVVLKPDRIGFKAAATVSTAFLTAYYGLIQLAKLKKTDRILIHAASTGVGMAAVQIAKKIGARIYTTASRKKWPVLRALGIEHIMDSRNLEFCEQIKTLTRNKGVNVVLNSLNNEYIPKSLDVLAPKGRFVEIGKIGIWSDEQVRQKRPDVLYCPYDLNDVAQKEPVVLSQMLMHMKEWIDRNWFEPLVYTNFDIHRAKEAFRYMAKAEHVGKVVITVDPGHVPDSFGTETEKKTFLITGGTGALGLAISKTLIDQGPCRIILVARNQPHPDVLNRIKKLSGKNAAIEVVQADVSDVDQIKYVFAQIGSHLDGIVHAAGVLDDKMVMDQDVDRFEKAMAAKVKGALNLHELSLSYQIEFFVMFSSIASVLGNAGQASYAAANAFLDAFALYRRSQGLAGIAINWGAWQAGMGAGQHRLAAKGVQPLSIETGCHLFASILSQNPVQIVAMGIDWEVFQQNRYGDVPIILSDMATLPQTESATPESQILHTLEESPADRRFSVMLEFISQMASKVLGNGHQAMAVDRPLMEQGFDSLMAVELRNRIGREFNTRLPASLLFDYPTLSKISIYLLQDIVVFDSQQSDEPEQETIITQELKADEVIEELSALLE